MIPECIKLQYQIPDGTKASPGNELGIFEGIGDHYSKKDLDTYFSTLYPEIPKGTYPIEKNIDGAFGAAHSTALAGPESSLDFQAAMPLIWPQRTVLFQTDDEVYEEEELAQTIKGFFNTFFDAIDGSYCTFSAYNETGNCVTDDCLDPTYPNPNPNGFQGQLQCGIYEPTNVISISYVASELDRPISYTKRQCAEIMKLGLQGTTVVMSSGDYGVGQVPGDPMDNGCLGLDEKIFNPTSDANCPYVLSVGSTELVKVPGNDAVPQYIETATSAFASGGGFSNYYDVPYYQAEHVKNYFDNVELNFTGYTGFNASLSNVGDGVCKSSHTLPGHALAVQDSITFFKLQMLIVPYRQNRRPRISRCCSHRTRLRLPRRRDLGPSGRHVSLCANLGIGAHPYQRGENCRQKEYSRLRQPRLGTSCPLLS